MARKANKKTGKRAYRRRSLGELRTVPTTGTAASFGPLVLNGRCQNCDEKIATHFDASGNWVGCPNERQHATGAMYIPRFYAPAIQISASAFGAALRDRDNGHAPAIIGEFGARRRGRNAGKVGRKGDLIVPTTDNTSGINEKLLPVFTAIVSHKAGISVMELSRHLNQPYSTVQAHVAKLLKGKFVARATKAAA